jgi:23S rRNA pseudouridine1911/1915/1917 synthase
MAHTLKRGRPDRWVRFTQRVPAGPAHRLADVLGPWLGEALERPASKSLVRRLIVAGAVSVDGEVVRNPVVQVRAGASVSGRVDTLRLPRGPMAAELRVVFEDDDLLVIDKPAGLPMHAGADPARANLVDKVTSWLAAKGAPTYLGVHQRLDRDTSGVVLFTKRVEANPAIAEQFGGRTVSKVYWALVESRDPVPAAWTCEEPMPDGRPAATRFRALQAWPGGALVEARPQTGRKHQIRIHLASGRRPIVGDVRYGAKDARPTRVMLHARALEVRHPATGAPLVLQSEPPDDFDRERQRRRRRPQGEKVLARSSSKTQEPRRVGRFNKRRSSRK